MNLAAGMLAIFILAAILWDAFETVLLPRRTSASFRISRGVLRVSWMAWRALFHRLRGRGARESFLSFYPILTLLALLGVWIVGMIVAFALLQWASGGHLAASHGHVHFRTMLYMSGTNFFTLGLGDVAPTSAAARFLTVVEGGMGFGFLALVLAYLPVLYQSFSRREARVTMLDEWTGSPPSAAVMLRRNAESDDPASVVVLLRDWEQASAELLESHLSYPILAYFRSQHDNQSWLASLTSMMDACALIIVGVEGIPNFHARLTFAMARHAVVDLCQVFRQKPDPKAADRLPASDFAALREWLHVHGVELSPSPDAESRLADLRTMYEPYVTSLSRHLLMPLPMWLPPEKARYNWQTTAWGRTGDDAGH